MNDLNYQSVRWGGRRVLNSSGRDPLRHHVSISPCNLIHSYYFLSHQITQIQSSPVRSPVTGHSKSDTPTPPDGLNINKSGGIVKDLTKPEKVVYPDYALAKSSVRVDQPENPSAKALSKRLFFAHSFMVGVMGALRSAAPRSGKVNPVAPATLLIDLNGGSSQLSEGTTMSEQNSSPKTPVDAPSLCETVNFIDGLSQEGFSQIAAIANLLQKRLEQGIRHDWEWLDLHRSLGVIREKAQATEVSINIEAEAVGCDFVNESERNVRSSMRSGL